MTESDEFFSTVIIRLSTLQARVQDAACDLRKAYPETKILHAFDFTKHDSKNVLELQLEVTFPNREVYGLVINLKRHGRTWTVEEALSHDTDGGPTRLWEDIALTYSADEVFTNLVTGINKGVGLLSAIIESKRAVSLKPQF